MSLLTATKECGILAANERWGRLSGFVGERSRNTRHIAAYPYGECTLNFDAGNLDRCGMFVRVLDIHFSL